MDGDGDQAETPCVESVATAHSGDVVQLVPVVAHEQRGGPLDGDVVVYVCRQARAAVSGEHLGQDPQRRAALVVAVGVTLHDLGVRTERGVVDEGATVDLPEV